jgi:hypothetical protein
VIKTPVDRQGGIGILSHDRGTACPTSLLGPGTRLPQPNAAHDPLPPEHTRLMAELFPALQSIDANDVAEAALLSIEIRDSMSEPEITMSM